MGSALFGQSQSEYLPCCDAPQNTARQFLLLPCNGLVDPLTLVISISTMEYRSIAPVQEYDALFQAEYGRSSVFFYNNVRAFGMGFPKSLKMGKTLQENYQKIRSLQNCLRGKKKRQQKCVNEQSLLEGKVASCLFVLFKVGYRQ